MLVCTPQYPVRSVQFPSRRCSDAKHLAVLYLLLDGPVLIPPGRLALLARRQSQVNGMLFALGLGLLLLFHVVSNLVVVKHGDCLDHVRCRHALVLDKKQVLAILGVCRRAKVVRARVYPRRRLVVVNDDEFVVHAGARATSSLVVKVLRVGNGRVRSVADIEPAHGFVGQAIDHDIFSFRLPLDGVPDHTRSFVQKGERIEEARLGGINVGRDAVKSAFLGAVRREGHFCVYALETEVCPLRGRSLVESLR